MTSTTLDGKQLRRRIITTVGALNSKKTAWSTTTRINKLAQVLDLMKLLYISALQISIKRVQSQTRLTLTSVRNLSKGKKHNKCFNAFALTGRM